MIEIVKKEIDKLKDEQTRKENQEIKRSYLKKYNNVIAFGFFFSNIQDNIKDDLMEVIKDKYGQYINQYKLSNRKVLNFDTQNKGNNEIIQINKTEFNKIQWDKIDINKNKKWVVNNGINVVYNKFTNAFQYEKEIDSLCKKIPVDFFNNNHIQDIKYIKEILIYNWALSDPARKLLKLNLPKESKIKYEISDSNDFEEKVKKIRMGPFSWESKMYFGKYKDYYLFDIAEKDFQYILWCIKNLDKFYVAPDFFFTHFINHIYQLFLIDFEKPKTNINIKNMIDNIFNDDFKSAYDINLNKILMHNAHQDSLPHYNDDNITDDFFDTFND